MSIQSCHINDLKQLKKNTIETPLGDSIHTVNSLLTLRDNQKAILFAEGYRAACGFLVNLMSYSGNLNILKGLSFVIREQKGLLHSLPQYVMHYQKNKGEGLLNIINTSV